MSHVPEVNPPRIPARIRNGRRVKSLTDIEVVEDEAMEIDSCRIDGGTLSDVPGVTPDTPLDVSRSHVTGLDLSGRNVVSMTQSEFDDCRFVGTEFGGMISDVQIRNSIIELVNLRDTVLLRVVFEGCAIVDADLGLARLTDVSFDDCTIRGSEFHQTEIDRVDLRTSDLTLTDVTSLAGCTISTDQAIWMAVASATKLGLLVSDD